MNNLLTRFWFKSNESRGIGVTAYSLEDAINLMKSEKSIMCCEPDFESYIENINIQELDQNHVIPNMGVCTIRGIWYPNVG